MCKIRPSLTFQQDGKSDVFVLSGLKYYRETGRQVVRSLLSMNKIQEKGEGRREEGGGFRRKDIYTFIFLKKYIYVYI